MLASTYSFTSAAFRKPVHTARRSGRNLSYILFQNRRVQKSPFLCVNRIPIKYGFLFCASAIRYSVNHSRPQSPSFVGHSKLSRVALGTRMSVNITLLQKRRYLLLFSGERGQARGEERSTPASRFLCSPENPPKNNARSVCY